MARNQVESWIGCYPANDRSKCPRCTALSLQSAIIGDPETLIGFAVIWCTSCKTAARISRVLAPRQEEVVPFDQGEDVLANLSDYNWLY